MKVEFGTQAKVGHFEIGEIVVAGDKYVFRFDVTVDDVERVEIV